MNNVNVNSDEIIYIMMIKNLEDKVKLLQKISNDKDKLIFMLKTQLNQKEENNGTRNK